MKRIFTNLMAIFFAALCVLLAAPLPARADGDQSDWVVLFRADNPMLWNTQAGDPSAENGFAMPLSNAPSGARYLRLKRTDSGDAVIIAVDRSQMGRIAELENEFYWVGGAIVRGKGVQNKLLGISRQSWPTDDPQQQLVSRGRKDLNRGYRGWGFSKAANKDQTQTYSWNGEAIEKTVFEIAVKSGDLSDDEESLLLTAKAPPGKSTDQSPAPADDPPTTQADGSNSDPVDVAGPTTRIARLQSTIKALFVVQQDHGDELGLASDLILTATPGTAKGYTPVTFATPVGNEMHMVLDDVLRAIHVKYPKWAASKVELSFEDKYSHKDGGSIGAAIGTLILSMIKGFDIDPNLAMTGDVTADSRVRPIGGVSAKLRGATEAQCTIVALPADNYNQLVDAFVYEGPELITNIQVIGISNLDDAVAVSRLDRDANLTDAIAQFTQVQQELKDDPKKIHSKEIQSQLAQVVDLEPRHFSAKLLLMTAQNLQPKKLSATATMYYTVTAFKTVWPTLMEHAKAPNPPLMNSLVVQEVLHSLDKVRQLADPQVVPFVNAYRLYIEALNDLEYHRASPNMVEERRQVVLDTLAKLQADRDLMEKMLYEGI